MKRTSFFYYSLMLGVFVALTFTACDDPKDPEPTNPLESKSFKVTDLDSVAKGNFSEHAYSSEFDTYLKCKYVVHNKTNDSVKYHIKLEKIEAEPSHQIMFCILESCVQNAVSVIFPGLGLPHTTTEPKTFTPKGAEGSTTYPDDSYIKMWSGASIEDSKPGVNKFRLTYSNANDPSDYVTFVLSFNFWAPVD